MNRRVATVVLTAGLLTAAATTAMPCCGPCAMQPDQTPAIDDGWPLWTAYLDRFVQDDGRVIDDLAHHHSTSEGQAYGLFHALVADDREHFDRLLGWTRDNLATGDLAEHLPGWQWGRDTDGSWRALDDNPAADADLWLGYSLVEAGRLWCDPELDRLGRAVLARVVDEEVADLPGLGPMLLPAPRGFQLDERTWRLNPSYLPLQLLHGLAAADVVGPWAGIAEGTLRMVRESTPHGLIADWIVYREGEGFGVDPVSGPVGSHDAIRVYLWAGMLHADVPERHVLAHELSGMLALWRDQRRVPTTVDPWSGEPGHDAGSPGFLAALLPVVHAVGTDDERALLDAQIEATRAGALFGDPPAYYDQNLLLFARGLVEQRYRFEADGSLWVPWAGDCEGSEWR